MLVFNALELGVPRFFLGLEGGEGKVYYPDGRIRNVQGVAITGGYSSKLTTTSFEVEIGVFKGDPVGPAIQAEYATIHGYGISVPGEMGKTILDLDSPSNPNTIPTSIDEIFETLPNGSGIYGITGTALDAAIELQYIYIADRSQNFTIFHSLFGRDEFSNQNNPNFFDLQDNILPANLDWVVSIYPNGTFEFYNPQNKNMILFNEEEEIVGFHVFDDEYFWIIHPDDPNRNLFFDPSTKSLRNASEILDTDFPEYLIGEDYLPRNPSYFFDPKIGNYLENSNQCFLPTTKIHMKENCQKDISEISVGDKVRSFYGLGDFSLSRVASIFRSEVYIVLNFHGTGVTPGHVYRCGAGRFEGGFAPLIDILRTDGAIVDAEGNLLRAATKQPVDGPMDRPVRVVATGGRFGAEAGWVRTGTLIDVDGEWVSVAELIGQVNGTLLEDGKVRISGRSEPVPLLLPVNHVPKPEDYVLAMSDVTLAEIYEVSSLTAFVPAAHRDDAHA